MEFLTDDPVARAVTYQRGCAARHVTGCSVPLNRHATATRKRYRVGREVASGLRSSAWPATSDEIANSECPC
jgi:hypothetical protein